MKYNPHCSAKGVLTRGPPHQVRKAFGTPGYPDSHRKTKTPLPSGCGTPGPVPVPQPHPGPHGRSPASEKHFALTSCRLRGPWPGPCPLPPAGAGPEGSQRWTRPSPTAGPDQDLGQKKASLGLSGPLPGTPRAPWWTLAPRQSGEQRGGRVQQIKGGEQAVGKLRVCLGPVPWPGRGRSSSRPCQDILPNETQNATA